MRAAQHPVQCAKHHFITNRTELSCIKCFGAKHATGTITTAVIIPQQNSSVCLWSCRSNHQKKIQGLLSYYLFLFVRVLVVIDCLRPPHFIGRERALVPTTTKQFSAFFSLWAYIKYLKRKKNGGLNAVIHLCKSGIRHANMKLFSVRTNQGTFSILSFRFSLITHYIRMLQFAGLGRIHQPREWHIEISFERKQIKKWKSFALFLPSHFTFLFFLQSKASPCEWVPMQWPVTSRRT